MADMNDTTTKPRCAASSRALVRSVTEGKRPGWRFHARSVVSRTPVLTSRGDCGATLREAPGLGRSGAATSPSVRSGAIAQGTNESPGTIAHGVGAFSESPDSAAGVDPEMMRPDSAGAGKPQHKMRACFINGLILRNTFNNRFEMSRLRLPVQLSKVRSLRSELSL